MTTEQERRLVLEVPNLDRLVHGTRRQQRRVEMQPDDTTAVTGVGRQTVSRMPIPNLDGSVDAAADKLGLVELEATNAALMAFQRANLFAGRKIPYLDSSIVRSGSQHVVIEL